MKILIVGQTPPPYGGQAYIIDCIVNAQYKEVEIIHLRMSFSQGTNENGKVSGSKLKHFVTLILKTYYLRFRHNISCLYYPPSNAPKISVYRDIVFLLLTRLIFKKTILHFHAAGISEFLPNANRLTKLFAKPALYSPDLTITLSEHNPKDAEFLGSKKNYTIPYGIPQQAKHISPRRFPKSGFTILFVGKLNLTKGEGFVLEAMSILKKRGLVTNLLLAGQFDSSSHHSEFFRLVEEYKLIDQVKFLGIITGEQKDKAFSEADVFCFPSFFVSESFGIVLIEAMQYGLPIIASKWRGIQSIVDDGKNGFLVDIKNALQIADRLERVIQDPTLYETLSKQAVSDFREKYSFNVYRNRMEEAFLSLKKT